MNRRIVILMMVLLLAPMRMLAQWGFDATSVEALIDDHKDVRAKMQVRAVIEEGNALLQSWSNDTIKGYKQISDLLDKYDHYFEILDLILSGARVVVKVHQCYNTIDGRLEKMTALIHDFNDKCLKTGKLESSDKIIIEIGKEAVEGTYSEIEQLLTSIGKILAYQGAGAATGLMAMSTSSLIEILDSIDRSLDRILLIINHAYFRLRGYILCRIGPFFRRTLYRSRPVMEVATDALSRWLNASHGVRN